MKKRKNSSLSLNKINISKINNMSNIYGGTDSVNDPEQVSQDNFVQGQRVTSYCTQVTMTTGEVTAHEAVTDSGPSN